MALKQNDKSEAMLLIDYDGRLTLLLHHGNQDFVIFDPAKNSCTRL